MDHIVELKYATLRISSVGAVGSIWRAAVGGAARCGQDGRRRWAQILSLLSGRSCVNAVTAKVPSWPPKRQTGWNNNEMTQIVYITSLFIRPMWRWQGMTPTSRFIPQ